MLKAANDERPGQADLRILRLAAFSDGDQGGNPAGVALSPELPQAAEMQRIAAEVGYSETAFAAPQTDGSWRVRYFAPEAEVPFCGHATIALGAALAMAHGDGRYALQLNESTIEVEGRSSSAVLTATLTSPPTRSGPADDSLLQDAMQLFALQEGELDRRLEPAIIEAGARHLILPLADRDRLAAMRYDFETGKALMRSHRLVTIALTYVETERLFHVRNAFASGGVYEDPATGAAAAALGGYLRKVGWAPSGTLTIIQGEDMGSRSLISLDIPPAEGSGIHVSGAVRSLT